VRGAVALARRLQVPTLIVALTMVALGTSLPEFIVALQAVFTGYPGILLGNVVGSNIANVLLVGGLTAVIYPLARGDDAVRRDSAIMVVVSLAFAMACLDGEVHRGTGAILTASLVVVLLLAARDVMAHRETRVQAPSEWILGVPSRRRIILLFVGVGIVGLPVGARLVVESAVDLATALGVPETVVGLTIVAVSTSLPELATTVVAAYRQQTEMVLGTIVGSNIFNIVFIMGVSALASPVPIVVPAGFITLDLPVMLAAASVLTLFVWLRLRIGRVVGALLTLGYAVYVVGVLWG
jgi:cation:H+ antiporter